MCVCARAHQILMLGILLNNCCGGLNIKYSQLLVQLWESCGTFRRWSLAGRSGLLGLNLETVCMAPPHFLFTLLSDVSQLLAPACCHVLPNMVGYILQKL